MLLDLIEKRFSVRKFKDKPIEQEKLDKILKAARLAPSARNYQPWKFVVIRDETKRQQLTEICKGQKFVSEAPVTIAICCTNIDYRMTCGQPAYIIDGALASQNITLEAFDLGLGTCWIGAFYQAEMAKLINLPKAWEVVGLIALGYPDIEKGKRDLKPENEVIAYF